jgi:hypothetical protein
LKSSGADLFEVLHVSIYAAPYLERYFHRRFESRRVRGEWYLLDESDWEWLRVWFNRYAEYCNHTGKIGNGRYYWNPALISWVETAWWQPKPCRNARVQCELNFVLVRYNSKVVSLRRGKPKSNGPGLFSGAVHD